MKKTRFVFESNSSSSHSVIIGKGTPLMESITPNENGEIIVGPGEFGWEWVKYNDASTKLTYLAIYSKDNENRRTILEEAVMEHTGCQKLIYNLEYESNNSYSRESYIDHQSMNQIDVDYIFLRKEYIVDFIFNKKNYICTGNDNGGPPDPNFYVDEEIQTSSPFCLELKIPETIYMGVKIGPIAQNVILFSNISESFNLIRWGDIMDYETINNIEDQFRKKSGTPNGYMGLNFYFGKQILESYWPDLTEKQKFYDKLTAEWEKSERLALQGEIHIFPYRKTGKKAPKSQLLHSFPAIISKIPNPLYNAV